MRDKDNILKLARQLMDKMKNYLPVGVRSRHISALQKLIDSYEKGE